MILRTLLCILITSFLSSPCLAGFALRSKAFSPEVSEQKVRKEFKIDERMKKKLAPEISKEDIAAIVPTDMETTNNGQQVRDNILRRLGNSIMKSDMIKNSFLMKTAKKVEKKTKMDMSVEQEVRGPTNAAKKSIDHKFKFDIQALKGEAKIVYSGLIDSRVEYRTNNNTINVFIEEKLSENSKIALHHQKDQEQSRQLIQYEINW